MNLNEFNLTSLLICSVTMGKFFYFCVPYSISHLMPLERGEGWVFYTTEIYFLIAPEAEDWDQDASIIGFW